MQRAAPRLVAILVIGLSACTTDPPAPVPAPSVTATSQSAAPGGLAAAEPVAPTAQEFRRQAKLSCAAAVATIEAEPLRGDPLAPSARRAGVRAAVRRYRAAERAWTAAAGQLFEFGLPRRRAGQDLITALDTVAQYSKQVADFLDAGDAAGAQSALGATDEALRQANRIARRLDLGPLESCGFSPRLLRNTRRVAVTATDFAFEVGAVVPGRTRFVLRNAGREHHQLFVVRLRAPGTLNAAVQADRDGGEPGQFLARRSTVSDVAAPGGRARADLDLRPGSYGLLCFVASVDGTPHAYKGMAIEISVQR